jgi:hypothetical protein
VSHLFQYSFNSSFTDHPKSKAIQKVTCPKLTAEKLGIWTMIQFLQPDSTQFHPTE